MHLLRNDTFLTEGTDAKVTPEGPHLSPHLSSLLVKNSNSVFVKSLKEVKSDYWE